MSIIKDYKIDLDFLLESNKEYLDKYLGSTLHNELRTELEQIKTNDNNDAIKKFSLAYIDKVKKNYLNQFPNERSNNKLNTFIDGVDKTGVVWGNCLDVFKQMQPESISLMVTSPPYYNAREYSQWENLNKYLDDMRAIIHESYTVLENHRVWVFNVGDIFDNDNLITKSVWGKRKIPLSAYFIKIFEEEGFTFVDDFIWNKGEVESQRQFNDGKFTPFYQYPINCYEHILIFHKHRLDKTKIPCPVCGSLNVNGNTQSEIGLQSWECKNQNCLCRSDGNRGKRFSIKTNTLQYYKQDDLNAVIDKEFIKKWRKDIVDIKPVFKINNKGENKVGHSAPFPEDIPEMAVRYFSYTGEKVLDPFAGSFTSPIVAAKLGRIGLGVELCKDYRDTVVKRLNDNNLEFKELEL